MTAMAKGGRKRGKPEPPERRKKKPSLRQREEEEIAALEQAIATGVPVGSPATALATDGQPAAPGFSACKLFKELPLSERTLRGLTEAGFESMTAIQRSAIPHALRGRDILGAAKTGSGKTLAFLVPAIELLYRKRWSKLDGVGILVISPTRELALQIFNEVKKVGKHHALSGGLLIGGKDVESEKECVNGLNILVCTPGRLLQHMDETPNFGCDNLQVLILDEADRILDLGFQATVNAIVANLPKKRQTMLFSATQTKSVRDLARLSLKDPEFLSVHADAKSATPSKLQQSYLVCDAAQKLEVLWSFLKTHLKSKVLVFLSTCKQVKFVNDAFCHLRPGIPIRHLHGKMAHMKRMAVYYEFCKPHPSVLICTDIAARGLNFPTVEWVVQVDCPEDVATYIHRVGRTARYVAGGKALLFLQPSERAFLGKLEAAKVPLQLLKINPKHLKPVTPALEALLSKDAELKHTAQRAFVSYTRSIYLQKDKEVFQVDPEALAEYALSLGLPTAPKIRIKKQTKKGGAPEGKAPSSDDEGEGEAKGEDGDAKRAGGAGNPAAGRTSPDGSDEDQNEAASPEDGPKKKKKKDRKVVAEPGGADASGRGDTCRGAGAGEDGDGAAAASAEEEDGEGLLQLKRADVDLESLAEKFREAQGEAAALSRKQKKALKISKGAGPPRNNKVVFDDADEPDDLSALPSKEAFLAAAMGGYGGDASGDDQKKGHDERGADVAMANHKGAVEVTEDGNGVRLPRMDAVNERFARLRALMRERDAEDKQLLKERLREKRHKEKAKAERRRERMGEGEGGAVAMLGRDSDDSEGGDDDDDDDASMGGDDVSGHSGSEEEGMGRERGRQVRLDSDESDGDHDRGGEEDGDSEDDLAVRWTPSQGRGSKRARLGEEDGEDEDESMGREGSDEGTGASSEEEREARRGKSKKGKGRESGKPNKKSAGQGKVAAKRGKSDKVVAGMSLKEQEALALSLLGRRG
eukprot:jgi/Mesvir1/7389/Mv19190-RA.1